MTLGWGVHSTQTRSQCLRDLKSVLQECSSYPRKQYGRHDLGDKPAWVWNRVNQIPEKPRSVTGLPGHVHLAGDLRLLPVE